MDTPVIFETADTKIVTEKLDPVKSVDPFALFDLMEIQLSLKSIQIPEIHRVSRYMAKEGEWVPSDLMLHSHLLKAEEYLAEIPDIEQVMLKRSIKNGYLHARLTGKGASPTEAVKDLTARLKDPSRSARQEWKKVAGILPVRGALVVTNTTFGVSVWRRKRCRSGYHLMAAKAA